MKLSAALVALLLLVPGARTNSGATDSKSAAQVQRVSLAIPPSSTEAPLPLTPGTVTPVPPKTEEAPKANCTVQMIGGTGFMSLTLGPHRRSLSGSVRAQGMDVANDSLPFTRITDIVKGYTATSPDGPKVRAPLKYTKLNQVVVLGLNIEDMRDVEPEKVRQAIVEAVQTIRFANSVPVLSGISLVYGFQDRGEVEAFNDKMYQLAQELKVPFAVGPMLRTAWKEIEIVEGLKNKKGAPTPPSAFNLVVAQACGMYQAQAQVPQVAASGSGSSPSPSASSPSSSPSK